MAIEDIWANCVGTIKKSDYAFYNMSVPNPSNEDGVKCRMHCRQNSCGFYNKGWGCPPAVGEVRMCMKILKYFGKACMFTRRYEVDPKDRETVDIVTSETKNLLRKFNSLLKMNGYDTLALCDGGCNYCATCSYPAECPHPEQMLMSEVAYGVDVEKYLKENGIPFKNESNAVTIYSIVLYNPPEEEPVMVLPKKKE